MLIAIASGKGGTGKTLIATHLAQHYQDRPGGVTLLDADVEEPNDHLFIRGPSEAQREVDVLVPVIDTLRCGYCGACATICEFGAIVASRTGVTIFPELCHSCGACARICPSEAITEQPRTVGTIEPTRAGALRLETGRLNVGEARAVPVIAAVRKTANGTGVTLIDAPPGTSCAVMEAIRGVDFVCLVAEPTPFGLHDLQLVVELTRALKLPAGLVINRVGLGDDRLHRFAEQQNLPLLGEIPDDDRIARACSEGELASPFMPELDDRFAAIAQAIESRVTP